MEYSTEPLKGIGRENAFLDHERDLIIHYYNCKPFTPHSGKHYLRSRKPFFNGFSFSIRATIGRSSLKVHPHRSILFTIRCHSHDRELQLTILE